jgi:hypothetical protein
MGKAIRLTARAGCRAGHSWEAAEGTGILSQHLTQPIGISVDLGRVGKCPGCGDAPSVIRFMATPES